jgi:predicted secreted hydrolase
VRACASRVAIVVAALVIGGCGGPILANPPRPGVAPLATPAPTAAQPDPVAVDLPRDDAPHDRLTEWWYYTGHLASTDGRSFGFEFVIFRAERGAFPTTWASHLALTDETGNAFHYAQRSEIGSQVDHSSPSKDGGFDLAVSGADATQSSEGELRNPWTMAGANGTDRLRATATVAESGATFGLDLALNATKAPVLHDRDGWIDFARAGGSYYYSRTAMNAEGSLTLGAEWLTVRGTAWFDHQWGDFISVGGSGWDWFAINLEDGTDLTLSLVRDADGGYPLVYGTLVEGDGTTHHLNRDAFRVEVTDGWTSPTSGAEYPAAWVITLPAEDLTIRLTPTVADQELDTRATTGVVYWEGSQHVEATRRGAPVGGKAYVELTGYAQAPSPLSNY